jgi:hypothetical protein
MLRTAPFALLVASILTFAVQAQRSGATLQSHAAGPRAHSGFGQRRLSNQFFPPHGVFPDRFHRHHDHDGVLLPYFFPEYEPFWYEQPDSEEVTIEAAPSTINEPRDDGQLRMGEKPVPKAQIIDIPEASRSRAAKILPSTIFILRDGERLESREFLLTTSDLSVNVNHYRRTIPLQMLDGDATITANRQRGINFRIPDQNEISLSF